MDRLRWSGENAYIIVQIFTLTSLTTEELGLLVSFLTSEFQKHLRCIPRRVVCGILRGRQYFDHFNAVLEILRHIAGNSGTRLHEVNKYVCGCANSSIETAFYLTQEMWATFTSMRCLGPPL